MPPKPESVGTCEDVGVLGVVTGVIGTLQALEAIKLLTTGASPTGAPLINLSRPVLYSEAYKALMKTWRIKSLRCCCFRPSHLRHLGQ